MANDTTQAEPHAVITITLASAVPGFQVSTLVEPSSGLGVAAAATLSAIARAAGQELGHALQDAAANPRIGRA